MRTASSSTNLVQTACVPGARRPTVGQPRQERSPLAPAARRTLTASSAADFRVPHPRTLAASPGPARPAARALAIGRSSEGRSGKPRAAALLVVCAVAQRHCAPPPQLRQDWRWPRLEMSQDWSCAGIWSLHAATAPQSVGYLCEIEIAPTSRPVQALDPLPPPLDCVLVFTSRPYHLS